MEKVVSIDNLDFEVYIHHQEIQNKIFTLAKSIEEKYEALNPIFLVVMNGAFIFAADLLREIHFPSETAFLRIKSYEGTHSTGVVNLSLPQHADITGRHVIIIEDIVDTGNSMEALLPELRKHHPVSIAVASLLFKPEALEHDIVVDFPGFVIPKYFVIGYGLDYNEKGRNLKDIYKLKNDQ